MLSLTGKKNLFAARKPVWWVGIMLSAGVGLLFYVATSKSIESDSRARFTNIARTAQHSINARISAYTNLLRGTASLFQATDDLSREQFHRYVASLAIAEHFPAIETVNFARYVRDAERPALEAAMRRKDAAGAGRSGYPPFAIQPPAHREHYLILDYIDPLPGAESKIGFDIATNPLIAQGMLESRDSGRISNSGQPVFLASRPNMTGLAMRLPVYRNGMPLDNVAGRRAAFIGSVGVGFSVATLVQGILDEMPVHNVRLALFDAGKRSAPQPQQATALFDSGAAATGPRWQVLNSGELFSTTLPIDFNERQWNARFSVRSGDLYSGFDIYFPWLAMLAGFVGTMLIYVLFHTLSSSRMRAVEMARAMTKELRDSQIKLQISHRKLRRLAAHADQIKEEERKRIAREIHDDLGQNLLVLRIEADMLASRTQHRHPRLYARARSTLGQIDTTIKSVRQIINDLRPTVLDLGLNAAVEWQIAEFRRHTGIRCELIEGQAEISVNDHCATAFFRILQESLSNIAQHAGATLVQVALHQSGSTLSMTVSDNGVGVKPGKRSKRGSFGLVGIEERIKILGGHFSMRSGHGAGVVIHVTAPVDCDAAAYSYLAEPVELDG